MRRQRLWEWPPPLLLRAITTVNRTTPVDLDALLRDRHLNQLTDEHGAAFDMLADAELDALIAELRASRKVVEAVRRDPHPISRELAEAFAELEALNGSA